AEPDTANGVSGPPHTVSATVASNFGDPGLQVINNTNHPFGGTAACPWTTNNCGVNDETFSFHGAGANHLFGDGHVNFLNEKIDPIVRSEERRVGKSVDLGGGGDIRKKKERVRNQNNEDWTLA